jgi:hypothetical protein
MTLLTCNKFRQCLWRKDQLSEVEIDSELPKASSFAGSARCPREWRLTYGHG